jgi:multidrug resistance efflux pump
VAEVAVHNNQPVRTGDVLLRLDDRVARAALDQAKAAVSAAQADVAAQDAQLALQGAAIAAAQAQAAGEQLRLPQVVRALGQPLLMPPMSQLATSGFGNEELADASALFNALRNLGASIGIALVSTLVEIHEHYHFSVIDERIAWTSAFV